MKKLTATFLFIIASIHIALFVHHASEPAYLWTVDLFIAGIAFILFTWLMLPTYETLKPIKKKPAEGYGQLSTHDLLVILQKANETEKAIERELEVRYSETQILKAV